MRGRHDGKLLLLLSLSWCRWWITNKRTSRRHPIEVRSYCCVLLLLIIVIIFIVFIVSIFFFLLFKRGGGRRTNTIIFIMAECRSS